MISTLLQVIAPDDCLECGREGQLWCEWCRLGDEALPSRCFRCHKQTDNYGTCTTCRRQTGLKRVYVTNEYKDVAKELVKGLKYSSKRQAAKPMASCITEVLPLLSEDTVVTNLPTAPARVRQRGFDHTQYIAKTVAKQKELAFVSLLGRTSNVRQVGADKKQRIAQVKDSYRLRAGVDIKGKSILLIDDVITTGASLSEASKVLRRSGAKEVVCAVFAYSK